MVLGCLNVKGIFWNSSTKFLDMPINYKLSALEVPFAVKISFGKKGFEVWRSLLRFIGVTIFTSFCFHFNLVQVLTQSGHNYYSMIEMLNAIYLLCIEILCCGRYSYLIFNFWGYFSKSESILLTSEVFCFELSLKWPHVGFTSLFTITCKI